MGILGQIINSSSNGASGWDAAVTGIICGAVILGILIIALVVWGSIRKVQNAKIAESNNRKEVEIEKIAKENNWKGHKTSYDAAWRTIEHYWKEASEEAKAQREKDKKADSQISEKSEGAVSGFSVAMVMPEQEKECFKQALEYVKFVWTEEMKESSNPQPESK